MLLGHQTFLLFGLHGVAFLGEHLHLAFEHLVLAQLALQRTVVERGLQAGFQAYLVEALLTIGEHPGIIPLELVLEPFSHHLIGAQEVGCGDTFAIGWVGDDDAFLCGVGEVLEVLLVNGDAVAESGSLHIETGGVDGLHLDVVAVDVVGELPLLRVVIIDAVEKVGIEVGPFLEGKLLAEQAWCHVTGNEGSLDGQGA